MKIIPFLLWGLFFVISLVSPSSVLADFALAGSESFAGTTGVAMPITDVQITGTGDEPIPVKLLVSNGTLSLGTTTGLTIDDASTASTLYFSGSLTNVNAALATLTYTRAGVGSDTLEISLVPPGEVFFPENDHLYKFISGNITANNARTAALAQTAYGANGYLVTITSQEENDFVAERLEGDGWMGASDAASEGDWKWLDGPEGGDSFWSGAADGNVVGDYYANWNPIEPNNSSGNEDCGQFYASTGRWNDLPCTNTLSGYVVEFGTPNNLPNVTAKNSTITTTEPPTVNTLSPTDGATGVVTEGDLTITFSTSVTVGTGSVLVKKSSDDSTVASIDVTSDQVSGSGTTTITLNPDVILAENTEYYISIPDTAFKDSAGGFYAGISNSTTWNFSTGDFTDPELSAIEASSITDTGATISWTTSEQSSSQLDYGLLSSYGTQTNESNTSPRVTSHSLPLSDLKPCARYFYRVRSTDSAANTVVSGQQTFATTGCAVSSIDSGVEQAVTTSGGTITHNQNTTTNTLTIPNNFYGEAADFQINTLDITNLPTSPSGTEILDNNFLDLLAVSDSGDVITSFLTPVTFTVTYNNQSAALFEESTLAVYKYTDESWVNQNCSLNTGTNTLSCSLDGFSVYAVFGETKNETSSSSSNNSNSDNSAPCTTTTPYEEPELFQIDGGADTATLFFVPVKDNTTGYIIEYGLTANANEHAVQFDHADSTGVISYSIHELTKSGTWYFKVRAKNQCAAGPWSEVLSTTVGITSTANTPLDAITQSEALDLEPSTDGDKSSEPTPPTEIIAPEHKQYTVSVQVQSHGKPLANTQIKISELGKVATTDSEGKITFEAIPRGEHRFHFAQQAYAAEKVIAVEGEEEEFSVLITLNINEPLLTTRQWLGILAAVVVLMGLLYRWKLIKR